ncbi:MAG: hypothetical protein H6R04_409 [Burkholderiaceae bacterium]|nr:hypothetical protein [Burkholderiaceae bacterium]
MKKTAAILMGACIVALSGCQTVGSSEYPTDTQAIAPRVVKITAVGHGATSSFDAYSTGQKRLMAMRASKLDAYRSLAEQVYGIRLTGNTTVGAMMVQNDSFRVYIDTTLRGARVQSITPMADGNYETVVEMDFDEALAREFAARQPAAKSVSAAGMTSGHMLRGMSGPGPAYGTTFYYAE